MPMPSISVCGQRATIEYVTGESCRAWAMIGLMGPTASPRLQVSMHAGRLVVRATAEATEVAVRPVRAKFATDARAVEAAAASTVEEGNGVVVVRVPDPPGRGRSGQVLVEVDVPTGTSVTVESGEAEVVCTGPVGALEVVASSGSVHAESVRGPLIVRTGRGPVTVHECSGPVSITASGGVVVLRAVSGPATIRSTSGDVHLWWLGGSAEIATTTGNVRLGWDRGAGVGLDLGTSGGTVRASVTSSGGAPHRLRVATVSGDIRVDPADRPTRPGVTHHPQTSARWKLR
jgi:hypothetical protein